MFFKKARIIWQNLPVDLTSVNFKINWDISSFFVATLENLNFKTPHIIFCALGSY